MNRSEVLESLKATIAVLGGMSPARKKDVERLTKLLSGQLTDEEIEDIDPESVVDELAYVLAKKIDDALSKYEKSGKYMRSVKWGDWTDSEVSYWDEATGSSITLHYPDMAHMKFSLAKTLDKLSDKAIKEVIKDAARRMSNRAAPAILMRALKSMGALDSLAEELGGMLDNEPHPDMKEDVREKWSQHTHISPEYDEDEYNTLPFGWHADERVESSRRLDPKKLELVYTFQFDPEIKRGSW